MQIMKRQRELTADERQMLEDMLNDEFAGDIVKAGVYLLLDRQEEFQQLFETMQEDEKKSLKEFPIWRFVRESEGVWYESGRMLASKTRWGDGVYGTRAL